MRQYTKEVIKKIIPEYILQVRRNYLANKRHREGPKRRKLLKFEMHLADHCNLNCKGCNHFSPLVVKEKFLDAGIFKKDCERIAGLSGGLLEGIRFMGGELLLHKNVVDILNTGRKYFPKATLDIVTNGILLPKQPKEFWETCGKNGIHIHISKYPIKINNDEIDGLARQYNVKILRLSANTGLQWHEMKLDVKGGQNMEENFRLCPQANNCINLYEGKLYTCPTIAYIQYLNEYHGENFVVTEEDYIDIYKARSMDEILDFLCKPVQFCRYCDIKKWNATVEWGVSKKERKEWIEE
ncbi:MAG: hypothetical protein LBE65_03765 [Synergistaceae bacterium]|jgi:MoaA/NifB/PqqE/SkfB family radical SAM enzyme|nr:hypothetical protein [Synergistaceae bacterium]